MRTESVGTDRRLAERLRREREGQLNNGKLGAVRPIRYSDFVAEEVETMTGRLAPNSISSLRVALDDFGQHCRPKMLADVTHGMVETYFSGRLKAVAVPTANCTLRTLKASFNRAVGRGYLTENPAARVRQVREPERTIRVVSPDEVSKLLEACPSDAWRAFLALALTTGMRLGELTALRWADLDVPQGLVHVVNSEVHLTKSRRNRVLALFPHVAAMLHALPHRGDWIFTTAEGNPWRNNVKRDFGKIVKRARIAHASLHDLRRSFCTHLAASGANAALVQQLAGHSSITTTVKYYVGLLPAALRSAQERLPFNDVLESYQNRNMGNSEPAKTEAAQVVSLACAAS
jgi:integrase